MKETKKINISSKLQNFDVDKEFFSYSWLLIPCLTVIYFIYSFYSTGFYQDDEVGHFMNMRDFWSNPFVIMSNWGKPGWKIFLVLPSLVGYKGVLFFNSLIKAEFSLRLSEEVFLFLIFSFISANLLTSL